MAGTTTETPRVYVACLASYNNGILHGAWIDATNEDEMIEAIEEMVKKSAQPGAEEWAIHDYEGFGPCSLDEGESIGVVAELGSMIEEHGPAFAVWADYQGVGEANEENFEDAYHGEWDSETAYAEDSFNSCEEVPDHLADYIDYEKYANDLFMSDCFSVESGNGTVYVFSCC